MKFTYIETIIVVYYSLLFLSKILYGLPPTLLQTHTMVSTILLTHGKYLARGVGIRLFYRISCLAHGYATKQSRTATQYWKTTLPSSWKLQT